MNNSFSKIKLSQLHILCNIIADTEVRHLSNIERIYKEKASSFDETLSFLHDLGILKIKSNTLTTVKEFSEEIVIENFKMKLLPTLFSASGEISELLRNFLLNFQIENDRVFFQAPELDKIKFSDTRNLLLELEFITISSDKSTYLVNPIYVNLFINHFSKNKLSPESLKKKQADNDLIGLMAEKMVIESELKRLTDISLEPYEIEHISLENVLAGYDIRSFENRLDSNSCRIPRYIEVKAVSAQDFKFYWSKAEMEIAKVLGEMYFLYLIPVLPGKALDSETMVIISNPYKNIYSAESDWKKQTENISFSKTFTNNNA